MFKNVKVGKSLIIGFGVTIIVSVAIIVVSLFVMNAQRAAYKNIIDSEVRANTLITSARLYANVSARNLRDVALFPDASDRQSKRDRAVEVIGFVDGYVTELDEIYSKNPSLDKNQLSVYENAYVAWRTEAMDIINVLDSGDYERARAMIQNSCTPLLNTLGDQAGVVNDYLDGEVERAVAGQERTMMLCIVALLIVMVIATVFVLIMAAGIIKSITIPVREVHTALMGFSEGNLELPVQYESRNELGDMCNALRTSQHVLSDVIGDECRLLEEMGNGNFDVRTRAESSYVGALSSVLKSIRAINRNLSDTLTQIEQSAEQVSAGSDQVSVGAQALAQGATEQASAVQELSATISDISQNARTNAKNSEEAMTSSIAAGEQVNVSAKHMEEMVDAMEKISTSSGEIGKIIATIENIAFQTNILALNAAVEAARAGSAGKGFAVVADEVRNLASKSDEAAKATKELIEHSLESVRSGNEIVKNVSDSLSKTVELAGAAMSSIGEISKIAKEEAEAIAQVTEGIDQISAVVQTNSATSEESAAASQELSDQATMMKDLMSRFKLRKFENSYSQPSQSAYRAPAASSAEYAPAADEETVSDGSVFSKY